MPRCASLLPLATFLLSRPLAGQTQVSGVRDLNFGVVVAGVPTAVSPNDPVKSGQFYVRYVAGGKIKVNFTLPSTLNRVGGGGSMPISFKNGDAYLLSRSPGSTPKYFNPGGVAVSFLLSPAPDADVYLGGRVSPSAATPTGSYTAPVVMTVTFF